MPAAASARPTEVLLLTDIHLDPFADGATADRLRRAPPFAWHAVLGKRRGTVVFPRCGENEPVTDAALLASAIDEIGRRRVAFTILSGDLLVHEFRCRFKAVFPDADDAAYREFAARTVEFVLAEVRRATHGKPVYLALGNHDSGCGNYRRDDHDPFLRRIAPAVARAAGGPRQRAIAASFAANGRYEVQAPLAGHPLSLLVVDTSLWSRRALTCNGDARAADEGQLVWLRDRMVGLKEAGQSVWLIGHIPPGIDPRESASAGAPVRYLRDDGLALALAEARRPIELALFGHTHMDEWRLFGRVPVRISPALSPGSGNRPSFTLARLAGDGSLRDYSVISFAAGSRSWAEDHSFSGSFGVRGFSFDTLSQLDQKMMSGNEGIMLKYKYNYSAGGTPASPNSERWLPSLKCALSSLTNEAYALCMQQGLMGNKQ